MGFRFKIIHIPGVRNKAADAISRYLAGTTAPERLVLPDDIAFADTSPSAYEIQHTFLSGIRIKELEHHNHNECDEEAKQSTMAKLESLQAVTWHHTKQETASDANMHQLVSIIENSIPEAINDLPPPLRTYHRFREHLHTQDSVILYKDG